MSLAYVSSPGVPTIRPRNFSGVGTVLDAGRWSTSSVVMRGSWRYSLIFAVYSASTRRPVDWATTAGAEPAYVMAIARATPARRDVLRGSIVPAPPPRGLGSLTGNGRRLTLQS